MAELYLAAPQGNAACTAASYALKLLKPRWENEPAAMERFAREALVGQAVSHAHLVPVLDWNLQQPPYYLVMPRLEGITLQQHFAERPLPALPVALWIVRQVAQALEGLHQAGWMHADIKPANIFVSDEGHVTLIDLGYAHTSGEAVSLAQRPVTGTLSYMAPEMLTSSLSPDIRSDIYSLGIVLFELLTGRLPYEGRNPAEVAALQREGIPDRLRCLAPLLPATVVNLVRQMIAKEPLRRPQTPSDLVRRLVALEIATLAERIAA